MLTIEECRKHLKNKKLTDDEVRDVRDAIYAITENVMDGYLSELEAGDDNQ